MSRSTWMCESDERATSNLRGFLHVISRMFTPRARSPRERRRSGITTSGRSNCWNDDGAKGRSRPILLKNSLLKPPL